MKPLPNDDIANLGGGAVHGYAGSHQAREAIKTIVLLAFTLLSAKRDKPPLRDAWRSHRARWPGPGPPSRGGSH
jgi:hypothetical protein